MAESQGKNEKKSPKKLILIVLAVVVFLGGGIGGYFYFVKMNADKAITKGGGHSDSAEAKEVSADDEISGVDVYYDLPSPLVVDFPAGSSAKVIKLSLTILVKGEASVPVLKKHEPMLRNNLLMTISGLGADKAKTTEGKQELREMMLAEVGKVLEKMSGKNTAKEVYFTEFVMQ